MTETFPIVLYQAVNRINGHRYIGITQKGISHRSKRHRETARRGAGAVIGAAIRKHGDDIVFSTLLVCPDFDYAKDMERAAIAVLQPEYNVTHGGDGALGLKHTAESRMKISAANRGMKHWLGKNHSEATKEKIRKSRLSGKGGPRKGSKYTLSDEERRRRGERLSAASKRALTGRKLSEDMIQNFCTAGNRAMSKPVVCVETEEVFGSLIELSRSLKCDRRRLRASIHAGNLVNGFTYKFISQPQPT